MTSINSTSVEFRCPPLELTADPGSEFWARAHAADVLRAWQLENLAGLVDTIVAEMVLNAVRYSKVHIAVIMWTSDGYLVLDVWDAGIRPSPFLTPAGKSHDELPLMKALADKWEVVGANRGGRIVRAWIRRDVHPDVLTIEQQLRAARTRSVSLLVPDEKPTEALITRVIEGFRALDRQKHVTWTPPRTAPGGSPERGMPHEHHGSDDDQRRTAGRVR
ncbi:anti-sigma regulatory factor (Ser/Thr protein kinase) [Catenulispora sp. GAS73]|uniref:ATP-binding protein n=1 Tax=Catenulispora sp. GAS73 TaxID=3156269 RepID=UPI003517E688